MGSDVARVNVTIRIAKAEAPRLDRILEALNAAGLTHADVHRRFLIVNGSVAADRVAALRDIAGVDSVREDRLYKTQD